MRELHDWHDIDPAELDALDVPEHMVARAPEDREPDYWPIGVSPDLNENPKAA